MTIRFRRVWKTIRRLRARLHERVRTWQDRLRPTELPSQVPVGSDKDLKNRFCPAPWEHFALLYDGNVYQCCPSWLPPTAGNLLKDTPQEAWNSPQAQAVRASILDGSYSYCDRKLCPSIQAGTLPTIAQARRHPKYRQIIDRKLTVATGIPALLNLSNDRSCNLSCPSCRCEKVNFVRGPGYDLAKTLQDKVVDAYLREPSTQSFKLSITGSGDPFASRVFREFLNNLDGSRFPNMGVHLQTNGTMFTPAQWQRLHKLHDNIDTVLVSFDAATEATYRITRRDGQWNALLNNMQWIGQLRRERKIGYLRLDFVVQDHNFREMEAFVDLARKFSADLAFFSRAVQWGTWTEEEYRQRRVWERDHPDYAEFLEMLARPVFADRIVDLGNLSEFRRAPRV